MPLVVVCGYPASGKSTISRKLEAAFKQGGLSVVLISDDANEESRSLMYASSSSEKRIRARLKSAVERVIDSQTAVIVDSLNYIKGFRYELYCISRAMSTQHVVVHAVATPETCSARNDSEIEMGRDGYPTDALQALIKRFEPPNERNRWDKPLFRIDTEREGWEEELNAIVEVAMNKRSALRPNLATVEKPSAPADALHVLDKVTRSAEAELLERIREGARTGDGLRLATGTKVVVLGKKCGLNDLRKLRKAFLNMSQMHPPSSMDPNILTDDYIDFINSKM